jgi:phosphatidylglycerophosphate synthase
VVIGRDFLILAGGMLVYRIRGTREFPPSISGKISTVFQVATVFWIVLSNWVDISALGRSTILSAMTSSSVLDVFFIATLLLAIVSGTQYVLKGIRLTFFPTA